MAGAGVSDDVTVAESRGQAPLHFTISDAADLTDGGWTAKLDANLAALRLLKALQAEGRKATAEEQQILAKYIGWGHTNLAPVVDPRADAVATRDPRVQQARQELETLLTNKELLELGESTANAHYSFNDLPRAMWTLVQALGFKGGTILEPAVGTGHFFGTMPGEILADKRTKIFGIDKEPIAAAIAQHLYQDAHIQNAPLQDASVPDNYFDLAISNVPFGRIPIFDPAFTSSERARMTRSVHNYFFAKAMDVVRPGGLIAFITSRYTMDSKDDGVRRYLAERGRLLGAIRLPDASFRKTAGTDVVTDVIVLQKYTPEEARAVRAALEAERTYANASAKDRKDMTKPAPAPGFDWIEAKPREVRGRWEGSKETFDVNEYYHRNKKQILGEENSTGKMARTNEPQYNVQGEVKLAQLEKAIERMNLSPDTYTPSTAKPREIAKSKPADAKQGSFILEKGKLYHYDKGTLVPSDLKGAGLDRAKAFIPLRDAYQGVLDAMVNRESDATLAKAQQGLKRAYDAFVKAHGHVSKVENARIIELDPNGSRVLALEETEIRKEKVDGRTVTTVIVTGLAPIFTKRTVRPVEEPTTAETPRDALVQSLAWKGQVDLPYMAALTGQSEAQILDGLAGEVFRDPQTHAWLAKDEYLSGDVVSKLTQAEAATLTDSAYQVNVDALKAVQPAPLTADEFEAPLGATWVPARLYEEFLREEGRASGITVRLFNSEHRTQFYVDGFGGQHQFLPAGADFKAWAEDAINGRLPTLKTRQSDGSEVVDPQRTNEYRESLAQLREAWQTWWRSKNTVADEIASIYNAMFNREAPRAFDGRLVVLPNASPDIQLRPWQKNVIWRALQSGNTLLAHAVGAGKTYAMIGIAGEMKRLGLAQKPAIVVPNHLVEQWRRDFLKMYPDAKVLVPTERDFQKKHRQRLISRIANNDWDAVIMAQTQFLRVAVRTETLQAFVEEQVQQLIADGAEQTGLSAEEFEDQVEAYGEDPRNAPAITARGVPRSVKDIARAVLRLRARLQKRLDQQKKDAPVVFEQTGMDALLVDEAHLFKNLYFSTSRNNISGLKGSDAQRSQDMYLKIRLINQASNGRNVHFATGTPISNAMSEMYTMFRYLAQPVLERLGMAGFDAWANGYAVARAEMEPTAEGGYKERTRLRDWNNLRELSKLFRRFADVILTDDLVASGVLKLPKLKGGRPTTIGVEPHPDMDAFMSNIAQRAEALKSGKVDPRDDNYLKLSTEASLAAIDMRLVNPAAKDYAGSRLRVAADEIAKRYKASHANLGAQVVFLDVGTPKNADALGLPGSKPAAVPAVEQDVTEEETTDEASGDILNEEQAAEEALSYLSSMVADRDLYSELKRLLVEKGVPADEIAFIHQAKEPSDQGRLFQMVRDGKVRVIMASTAKGGVGMNIQDRLVALHHLDVPWRPADMEQREGRILRQGNQNDEVEILRYVTKKSFDEYRWGLLATKQGFIRQFMRGELSTMEDTDPAQLDMQVAQALASGDPNVMKMLNLEREVKNLRARYTNYERKRGVMRQEKGWAASAIAVNEAKIEKLTPLLEQAREWAKAPSLTITKQPGHWYSRESSKPRTFDLKDTDARKAMQAAIVELMDSASYADDVQIGHAGPYQLFLDRVESTERVEGGREEKVVQYLISVRLPVKTFGNKDLVVGTTKLYDKESPPDYRRGLDYLLDPNDIERWIGEARAVILKSQKSIEDVNATLDKPFPQEDALKAKEAELHELRLTVSGSRVADADKSSAPAADGADAVKSADGGTEIYGFVEPISAGIAMARHMWRTRAARRTAAATPIVSSSSEEVEERWQAARGVVPPSLRQKAREAADAIAKLTRHFPEINPARSVLEATAHEVLLEHERAPKWAQAVAHNRIAEIAEGLTPAEADLLARALVLPDIVKDIDEGLYDGKELPFGYADKAAVQADMRRVERAVEQQPTVSAARDKRSAFVGQLTRELVEAELLPASVLNDARYYHRQVMAYVSAQDRPRIGASAGREVRQRQRGFQKSRTGGGDFNTRYVEAEFEWVAQALAELKTKATLDTLKALADRTGGLKQLARRVNLETLGATLARQMGLDPVADGPALAAQELKPFNQRLAYSIRGVLDAMLNDDYKVSAEFEEAVAELSEAYRDWKDQTADQDPEDRQPFDSNHPLWWPLLADLVRHSSGASKWAAAIFKAIRARETFIEQTLGHAYIDRKNPEDLATLAPEGYTTWQPKEGNHFFRAQSVDDRVLQAVLTGTRELSDQDRRAVMAMGGPRETWIIPEWLATTLDHFGVKAETPGPLGALDRLWTAAIGTWKQQMLLFPTRIFRYNLNNTSGDADAAMAYSPAIFNRVPGAANFLYKALYGKDAKPAAVTARMERLIELGVIDAGLTALEIPDVNTLPGFRRLAESDPQTFMAWLLSLGPKYYREARRITQYRENLLRVAAYDYMRARVENGERIYAASNPARVDALIQRAATAEGRDRLAALLARDLIGDYQAVSSFTQFMRTRTLPFFSFQEVNFKRYMRLFRNVSREGGSRGRVAGAAAGAAAGSAARTAMTLGVRVALVNAFMVAVALWNKLFWPEEDEELRRRGRQQLHLILGRYEDGSIRTIRIEGAFADFLEWAGLGNYIADVDALIDRDITVAEKLLEVGKATPNKVVQLWEPFTKQLFEQITGRKTFPDAFRPTPIRDRVEHLAGIAALDTLYSRVTGKPQPPGNAVARLIVYRTDPGEAAYFDVRARVEKWLEAQGRTKPGIEPTEKSNALYYWKRAVQWNDEAAAERWRRRYFELGGTARGMKQSVELSAPLGALSAKDERRFERELTEEQRAILHMAEIWYRRVYAPARVRQSARRPTAVAR